MNRTPRAHERVPLEVEVGLETEHGFYTGITADISEGGVFIATHMLPVIGDRLTIVLTLPGEAEAFPIAGEVRWVRDLRVACDGAPCGFGFRWDEIEPRALEAIRRLSEVRDSIYYEAA
jgi:uncharacterized protein (TIGR02266 family)